jgi:hypothetical protein
MDQQNAHEEGLPTSWAAAGKRRGQRQTPDSGP